MNQTIEEIDFELEKIEKDKNVMDYVCDLKHQKLSNIRSTLCTIEDMKYLPKNTILYFSSKNSLVQILEIMKTLTCIISKITI